MKTIRQAMVSMGAAVSLALVCAAGCGTRSDGSGPEGADGGGPTFNMTNGDTFGNDGGPVAPCPDGGLGCYVPANCTTSVSGTVYDPAGRNPLYNVIVFVPNDPLGTLPPITPGTHTCQTCDVSIGNYLAATTTDAKGNFTLSGMPAISHVPLVVQTGKWRREVFLPTVTACQDTAVAAANSRLPKNHTEGDLPQMALLTGGCDDLGCFLKSVGIDSSEFSAPHGGGRLDVYQGLGTLTAAGGGGFPGLGGLGGLGGGIAGAEGASLSTSRPGKAGDCTTSSCPLWQSRQSFEYYDIALFSCECGENTQTKPQVARQALHDWLDEGGKVFASHYHYTWFKDGPADFQGVANWIPGVSGSASGGGNYYIDTSFAKGQTFHDWLQNVGALDGADTINVGAVATSVTTVNSPATSWIYDKPTNDTKYLSFLTPVGGIVPEAGAPAPAAPGPDASAPPVDASADGAAEASAPAGPEAGAATTPPMETNAPTYCGKAVFTDLHTNSTLTSSVANIPDGCSGAALNDQQKALEYLFFDLSACVSLETDVPSPPPPPTR